MPKRSMQMITEWFDGTYNRKKIFNTYMWKYFNLFMGAYKINGVDEDQQEFILRRFWSMGKIACFIVEGTKQTSTDKELASVNDYPNGMIAFTDFAPVIYNIYDWPIVVNLVNHRGAKFIPTTPQNVNVDCVIGYCQKNKMPVKSIVEFYVSKITDIEMTIQQQLKSHKIPYLIATTPENENKMKSLFERVENDEDALYLSANEIKDIQLFNGNGFYILDKLYALRQSYENDLLTYLGVNNIGQMWKKEHTVVDEVNSNNQLINDYSDCFLDCVNSMFERVSEYLGPRLSIEPKSRPVIDETEEQEEEDQKGEEENV